MYRGRFAPSPTGPLHFGSLVAALGSWLHTRIHGGRWLVRMEDIDPPREVPGSAAAILRTLAAFGLEADESVLFQSSRTAAYADTLTLLRRSGDAYPCWCSRGELAAFGGVHPSACVAVANCAREPAWRLRVPTGEVGFDDALQGRIDQDIAREVGDFVLRRADGWCAYQLAVVVDDAAQGVTHVVRGADLIDSTPRQILLQRRLGLPQPAYLHLPLVLDAHGRKLSKQDHARPVDDNDPLPALRAALAFLGQPVPVAGSVTATLRAAIDAFDLARIPRGTQAVRNAAVRENDP